MAVTGRDEPSGWGEWRSELVDEIRRGFAEFLTVPTGIIVGFLLLAAGVYVLDRADVVWLTPVRAFMRERIFNDAQATSDLLGTIAGSIITVTSITFSLLLLAVQQAAGSLTFQVIDQFLRRRLNQIAFGFFVGLALYTLTVLATVRAPFNPVFGATLALLLASVALYLLLLLLYTTINQMRPVEIIETIHDHILAARERQRAIFRGCRRAPLARGPVFLPIHAQRRGYVVSVDVDLMSSAVVTLGREAEVVLRVSIGTYVAFEDLLAEVNARTWDDAAAVGESVRRAVHLERQRDFTIDPAYGIEQLLTIAWTSVSTSKSNPAPGLLTIRSLRDVLARWSIEQDEPAEQPVPVVYTDRVFEGLMQAFETLAVVSSESMQHQVFAEVAHAFAMMFDRLPADRQVRAEDLVLRIISALGDHVLTADLDASLTDLADALAGAGRLDTASAVRTARAGLAGSIGKLNSRATRVPGRG